MNDWLARFYLLQGYFPHLAVFLAWTLKSSAIVSLAWSIALFLRDRSAAARCWVWRCSLVGLAALLVFDFGPVFLWRARLALPANVTRDVAVSFSDQAQAMHFLLDSREYQAALALKQKAQAPVPAEIKPPWDMEARLQQQPSLGISEMRRRPWNVIESALPWLWAGVAALAVLFGVARTAVGLAWLRRKSTPSSGAVFALGKPTALAMGLRRVPLVCQSLALKSPLLVGFLRPIIYLPSSATDWDEPKLASVFLHELSHWKRGDFFWLQFARLVTALFWWNPLVWLSARRLNSESEEAADDLVIVHQKSAELYARALVEIAAADPHSRTSLGVSMLGYRSLEKRIQSLLRDNPWRGRLGKLATFSIFVAALAVIALASVYVGLPRSKAQDFEKMSDEQRKILERVLEHTKQRVTALRFTHVKVESTNTEEKEGKISKSPSPSKLEAWNDSWTNIHRAEFRPQVSPWTGGAAPFFIRDNTEINNGKQSYSFDADDDLNHLRATPPRSMQTDFLGPEDANDLIRIAGNLLQTGVLKARGAMSYTISHESWQGRDVVKIQEQFFDDNKVNQQRTFLLSPSEDDMLRFSELAFPGRDFNRPSQWSASEVGRTAAGIYYPKKFQRTFSDGKTRTVVDSTVTSFETLAALPAGITDLPKKPGDEYIAKTGAPVLRSALAVTCVDRKTGQPLAHAKVRVRLNTQAPLSLVTDADGVVNVPLLQEEITYLSIGASSPGFAPQLVSWRKYGDPLQLPASYQLKLSAASPISGKVVDRVGQPIPNASVEIYLSGASRTFGVFADRFDLCGVTAKTDQNGLWSFPNFPENLTGLGYRISCPGYQATTDSGLGDFRSDSGLPYTALRDGSAVTTLKQGSVLQGIITDPSGQAVPKCRVTVGRDIWGSNCPTAESDASGAYVLKGLSSQKTWLTLEVPNFKPVLREIQLPIDQPLNFVLQPGRILHGHVTLPDGTPCVGLNVGVDTWKNTRTLNFGTQTDAHGDFTWNGAPDEKVKFAFGGCQSREFLDGLWLQAGPEIQQVVMKPALRFTGQAIDAKTGQPIPGLRVVPGRLFNPQSEIYWEPESAKTYPDGNFTWKTDRIGDLYVFNLEAKGYKTFQTTPMATTQNEVTQTIRLDPE